MQNTNQVRDILLRLCSTALLRIRSFGGRGEADMCAIEADHVHNLPALVDNFSFLALSRYYVLDRPGYLKRATKPEEFYPIWEELREWMERNGSEE